MRAPPRGGDLFDRIASFNALRIAAGKAVLGKRKKPGASTFLANRERELLRLERELRDGSYRPGRYVEILVRDPKGRLVSAAPFRDRVLLHAPVHRSGISVKRRKSPAHSQALSPPAPNRLVSREIVRRDKHPFHCSSIRILDVPS